MKLNQKELSKKITEKLQKQHDKETGLRFLTRKELLEQELEQKRYAELMEEKLKQNKKDHKTKAYCEFRLFLTYCHEEKKSFYRRVDDEEPVFKFLFETFYLNVVQYQRSAVKYSLVLPTEFDYRDLPDNGIMGNYLDKAEQDLIDYLKVERNEKIINSIPAGEFI